MNKQKILDEIRKYADENLEPKEFRAGIDIVPVSGAVISPDDLVSVVSATLDGWFTEGALCRQFSKELCKFVGTRYAVLCNSGSSASLLALTALKTNVGRLGKKVVTCAVGFPTTITPIIQNNLIPKFIDINPETLNVDADTVLEAIDTMGWTAGIVLAHTLGFPFDVSAVKTIADELDCFLVEDIADALGAEVSGRGVGQLGSCSIASFFPAHHITTGEGGAVFTSSEYLYHELNSFRDWGRDCKCLPGQDNTCGKRFSLNWKHLPYGYDHKYTFTRLGYNLKMTELQGALGLSQLIQLPKFVEIRRRHYQYLRENLEQFGEHLMFVQQCSHSLPSPFGFPMTVISDAFTRKDLVDFLEENLIRTRPLFAGNITRQPMMENVKYEIHGDLSGADYVMERTFWIGCHPGLTLAHLDYVIEKIYEFMEKL
jgi:CDP-6-deoxy-D-xylo-4-hexulose-3-dehydrase